MSTPTERRRFLRSRFSLTGEVPSHGLTGYNIGCRCKTCRDENSAYQREWRARHKAQLPPPEPTRPTGVVCPACHRLVRVTRDGNFGKHVMPGTGGDGCALSGKPLPTEEQR